MKKLNFINIRRFYCVLIMVVLVFIGTGCNQKKIKENMSGRLQATIFNTGKSDAIFITNGSYNILIDTSYDKYGQEIVDYLKAQNITKIDYLILTHLDKDHIGGADSIIENFNIENIYKPDYESDSKQYEQLKEAANNKALSIQSLTKDVSFEIDGMSVYIDVPRDKVYDNENDYSLITTVEFQEKRLLFMGDAEKARCGEFVSNNSGKYDLVKLPHHGDTNKYLESLVVTAGAKWYIATMEQKEEVSEALGDVITGQKGEIYYTYNGIINCTIENGDIKLWQ